MKTQVNQNHGHSVANIIFFGITLSIFLLSIFFSIVQKNSSLQTINDASSLFWNRTSSPAMTQTVTEVSPIDLMTYLADVNEAPIAIQSWMTETSWTTATSTMEYINADYVEASIPIEDWMLSTESWSVANTFDYFNEATFTESEIALESWMVNLDEWNMVVNENYTEAPIAIEDWMVSLDSWESLEVFNSEFTEPEIALESWMVNIDEWEITNPELAKK